MWRQWLSTIQHGRAGSSMPARRCQPPSRPLRASPRPASQPASPLIDAGSIDESMTARPHANVLRLVVAGTNERSGPHMHYPGQTGQHGVERQPFMLAGVGRQPAGARTRTHTRPGRARRGFARFFVSRPSRYRHLKTQPDTQAAIQSARNVSGQQQVR